MNGVHSSIGRGPRAAWQSRQTGRDSSSALSPVVAIERLRMAQDSFHEPVLKS